MFSVFSTVKNRIFITTAPNPDEFWLQWAQTSSQWTDGMSWANQPRRQQGEWKGQNNCTRNTENLYEMFHWLNNFCESLKEL